MNEIKQIQVQKRVGGSIFCTLEDYNNEKPSRVFAWENDKPVVVPINYALSLMVDPHVKYLIDTFQLDIVKNKAEFLELVAQEVDESYAELPEPLVLTEDQVVNGDINPITDEQIFNILSEGRNIKDLFNEDRLDIADRAFAVASSRSDELSMNTIREIEEITHMGVGVSN